MLFHHKHHNGLSKGRSVIYGLTFVIQALALINIFKVDKVPFLGGNVQYINLLIICLPIIFVFLESHFLKNLKAEHTMSNYFKAFFVISSFVALLFFVYMIFIVSKILLLK